MYVSHYHINSDSADKAVSGEGKFEQLIVTSREIAASTAQLVSFDSKVINRHIQMYIYIHRLQLLKSKLIPEVKN